MAMMINGARIDEQVYEFGFEDDTGTVWKAASYDRAVGMLKAHTRGKLKMRCVYYTEWLDTSDR